MKTILAIVILLTSYSCYASEWHFEGDYSWRYDCLNTSDITATVFVFHGAGFGKSFATPGAVTTDRISSIYTSMLDECVLLVAPISGIYIVESKSLQVFDYTHVFTYGAETAKIIKLIGKAKILFNKPVLLSGGGGGAMFAYRVAATLLSLGKESMIDGLTMASNASPYAVSTTGNAPHVFNGLESHESFYYRGYKYYELEDEAYDYISLGLMHKEVKWTTPTIYVYSHNDFLLPEGISYRFATTLNKYATQFEYYHEGARHDIGEIGETEITNWLINRITCINSSLNC